MAGWICSYFVYYAYMSVQKKSVYIETTIPSFATAKTSRDAIIAGHQAATILFWENERQKYELYVSQYVIEECKLGDTEAADRRLNFLKGISVLPKTSEVERLGEIYQQILDIPERAKTDCFHLSCSVLAEIDYLLSWNCAHLGVSAYSKIKDYNQTVDLHTPMFLTPEILMEIEGSL